MKAFNSLIIIGVALIIAVGVAFYYLNDSTDMAPGDDLSKQESPVL